MWILPDRAEWAEETVRPCQITPDYLLYPCDHCSTPTTLSPLDNSGRCGVAFPEGDTDILWLHVWVMEQCERGHCGEGWDDCHYLIQ